MTKHILVALPALALGLSACSADDPDPTPSKSTDPAMKSDGIALTIPLSSASTGIDTSPINNHLTIVAYDGGGHKIETIVKNGVFDPNWSGKDLGLNKIYKVADYESVMSLVLSNEKYGGFLEGTGYIQDHDDDNADDEFAHKHNGIQLVAFYLPDESAKFGDDTTDFEPPYDLKDLSSEIKAEFILHHPAAENGIWTGAGDDDMNIPMSGALDITNAVKNYDPALWNENNPMFLNHDPLMLIRTMAKVTIVNGKDNDDNFLTGARFNTAKTGTLRSENSDKVCLPSDGDFVEDWQELKKASSEYVFYTFERDLTGINNQGLIEVFWGADRKKAFDFKPYGDGASQIKENPEWQGILRNHSYKFTIIKPDDQDVEIKVSVDNWEAFDFPEKI